MRDALKAGVVLAVAAMALSGCGSGGPAGAAGGEGTYIFLPKSLNNPYWADARMGMDEAADRLGVTAEFLGPPEDDAAEQVAIFESALARNPRGIAVSPNDPGSVRDVISRARAAGIPVIAWDGPVPDSEVQGYIGTDNVAAGEREGQALAEAIGGAGKVAVVIGSLSAPNLKQRLDGLLAALGKHPGIKAVGFDVVPQGIEGMQGGCVQALVSQKPFGMTADALELLVDMSNGKSKHQDGFEIDTGVVVVKPAELDAFLADAPH